MKKLAIISGSLSRGGAERVSIYLADKLRDFGLETVLVTMRVADKEYPLPEGVTRVCVPNGETYSIFSLRNTLKKLRPDVVLIMGSSNVTYAMPASMGIGAKIIVSERNSPANFAGRRITKWLSHYLFRFANGYVFQTNEAKDYYKNIIGDKGAVIFNPLFTDGLPEPYYGIREKRIVTAGRLVDQKNQELLINAYSLLPDSYRDYIVEIYGDGPNKDKLINLIKSKGLEKNIYLKGNVSDIFERICKASCFVMTSNFEGMPNALIEAMAIGLPCISTDCPCGGPRELIQDGVNGMLFNVGNTRELADSLEKVLSDNVLSKALSTNALFIKEKLRADSIVKQWYNYIMTV